MNVTGTSVVEYSVVVLLEGAWSGSMTVRESEQTTYY